MRTSARSLSQRMGRPRLVLAAAALISAALVASVSGAASAAPVGEFTTFRLGVGGYGGKALASGPECRARGQ